MICKIQPPNPNIRTAVEYNEKKMDGKEGIRPHVSDPDSEAIENGHVLATRNVPEGSSLIREMDRLKLLNMKVATRKKTEMPTFHMSVNPSATDARLSEAEAVKLIDEIMTRMGYGEQPYRIYKHTDIAREHYHVVSTRIGQDGLKIKDSFERLELRKILRELAPKYGFEIILNEEEASREEKTANTHRNEKESSGKRKNDEERKKYVPAFDRRSDTPTSEQLTDAFEDSMKWSFTTFEQLQALMLRRYNVLVEIERGEGEEDRVVLSGTDKYGKPVTPLLSEEALRAAMSARIREKIESTRMSEKKQQRARLEALAEAAAKASKSYEEFVATMERKGVLVVVSWSRDGKPFGVTWLDKATRCAWKGSDTDRTISWLIGTAEMRGWKITKDRYAEKDVVGRRSVMPSRKKTISVARPEPAVTSGDVGRLGRALAHGGRTSRSNESAARGKGRDIFDENEEEKLREEARQGLGD